MLSPHCSAKQIKNKAVVNEDPNEKLIKGAWRPSNLDIDGTGWLLLCCI